MTEEKEKLQEKIWFRGWVKREVIVIRDGAIPQCLKMVIQETGVLRQGKSPV